MARKGELVEDGRRQDLAGPQIALAAEIEVLQLVADAFQLGDGLEDLDAFGRHFRAGAVAADDGDAENVVAAHGDCVLRDNLSVCGWPKGLPLRLLTMAS